MSPRRTIHRVSWRGALLLLVLSAALPLRAAGASRDDAFTAGYVAAVLERQFNVSARSVRVTDGVVSVDAADLPPAQQPKIVDVLSAVPGVARVEVRAAAERVPSAALPPPVGFLPVGQLFAPLIADPRWPHFSATYRYYLGNPDLKSVAAVSFGETLPFYRDNVADDARWGQWETGVQAGVFSIFDLESKSFDLVNTDFFVSAFAGYRLDRLSALGRIFHQSSHLGDEFLLRRTRPNRINLSYEGGDVKLSYDLPWGVRPYAGGGYLFDVDPSTLGRGIAQAGAEFHSPWMFARGRIRPVAALDLQFREENNWRTDLSLRAGLRFESVSILGRDLQVLFEYFDGPSFEGQFYRQPVEYVGIGAHFNF